jgi:ribosome biogenesis GTPase
MAERFEGLVVRSTGSWYDVRMADGTMRECRIRGKLRLKGVRSTNPVVVGDVVLCESDETGECAIVDITPRRNYIIRRASNLSKESHIIAANIDQAALVVSLFAPRTAWEFVDRFLVTCEAYGIPVTIVLNKVDLARQTPEALEEFVATYLMAGYKVLEVSATEGIGIERLRKLLVGKTTLLSGNSGVGKSSLINAIDPSACTRTGEVSSSHHKGMHTTTFSQMYPLAEGGYIIDSPGIKGFGLIDITPDELARYFPDFMRFAPECGFYNCTHTHEPKCAILKAVEEGEIVASRYESYLKILQEDDKYRK